MKSVIVIDDDSVWSAYLSNEVNSHPGFEVIAKAASGREGKLLIEHHRPDVVIMDIIMPDDDGLKVIKHIRENYNDYQPYLYIITAVNTSSMRRMLKDLEIDFVGFKLITNDKIHETLDIILSSGLKAKKINSPPKTNNKDISDIIDDTILKIGLPTHLSGFLCIKTALYFILDNPNDRRSVYKTISSVLNMSRDRVDKNIRTAIDACMDSELYRTLFGKYKVNNLKFLYDLSFYIEKQQRGSEGE